MSTPKKKFDVEALLAKKSNITSNAVKGALAKLEEQKQAIQEQQIISHLAVIQTNTAEAVEDLRKARRKEAAQTAKLIAVAEAEEKFYEDADIDAYNTSITKASSDFLQATRK